MSKYKVKNLQTRETKDFDHDYELLSWLEEVIPDEYIEELVNEAYEGVRIPCRGVYSMPDLLRTFMPHIWKDVRRTYISGNIIDILEDVIDDNGYLSFWTWNEYKATYDWRIYRED